MNIYTNNTKIKDFTEQQESTDDSYIVVSFDDPSLSDEKIRAIRQSLPDGMNDLTELHWIFEIESTESCNEHSRDQLLTKIHQYCTNNKLTDESVAGILVCFDVLQKDQVVKMGFNLNPSPGVYRSNINGFEHLTLIMVSKLEDDSHNVFMRFFSSQQNIRQSAAQRIKTDPTVQQNENVEWLFLGYKGLEYKYYIEDWDMTEFQTMTAEEVIEEGRQYVIKVLHRMPIETQAQYLKDIPFVYAVEIQARQQERAKVQQEYQQRLRTKILDKLQLRFNISDADVTNVEGSLLQQDLATLEDLFEAALLSESFADFCDKIKCQS